MASTEWTGPWALKPFSQTWPASRVSENEKFFFSLKTFRKISVAESLYTYNIYYTRTVCMKYLILYCFVQPLLPLYTSCERLLARHDDVQCRNEYASCLMNELAWHPTQSINPYIIWSCLGKNAAPPTSACERHAPDHMGPKRSYHLLYLWSRTGKLHKCWHILGMSGNLDNFVWLNPFSLDTCDSKRMITVTVER